ncbi:MAG: putative sec-independent translocation TatB [Chloroflexi bacterium OLB15]|nr:MAG: putative sec-independent translocation TatB [Chloroflexi bacterium OLB15]
MEFLGIGGWEIVAIFIIMLIFAGPKRMLQWSYTLGKWVGVARSMWSQTAQQLEQELHESGVDIEVPRELPTRSTINASISKYVTNAAKPVVEPVKEVQRELDSTRKAITPGDPAAFKAKKNGGVEPAAAAPPSNQSGHPAARPLTILTA